MSSYLPLRAIAHDPSREVAVVERIEQFGAAATKSGNGWHRQVPLWMTRTRSVLPANFPCEDGSAHADPARKHEGHETAAVRVLRCFV